MTILNILSNKEMMKKPPLKNASLDALQYINATSNSNSPTQSIDSMLNNVGGNYLRNTISNIATPMVKKLFGMAELSIEAGSLVAGGAGLRFGYQAMSTTARVITGKAMIGAAQGLGGSMVAGGDRYDNLFGLGIGAFVGAFTTSELNPLMQNLSHVSSGMLSGGVSNSAGQLFAISRSSEVKSFSYTSLGISTWVSGLTGLLAKYGAAGITGGIVQSTVQMPADVLGAHIVEDFRNAHR